MTRAILIKLSVILNSFFACEIVKDKEINYKISFSKQGFHSNTELLDVIKTFNFSEEINVKGKSDKKLYYDKVPQESKTKRSLTEGLLDQPLRTRENKFEHSTKDRLLKPGRYISNKPRLKNIQLSEKSGQPFHHFERIGREISTFRLPGLPSLEDIRNHFDIAQERKKQQNDLNRKNQEFDLSLKILIDLKHMLENSTTGLKSRINEFTDSQMSAIQDMIRKITPLIQSRSHIEELIKIVGDPANVLKDTFAHFDQEVIRTSSTSTSKPQRTNPEIIKNIEPQRLREHNHFIERKDFIPKSPLDNLMEDLDKSDKKFQRIQGKEDLSEKKDDLSKSQPSSISIFDFLKPPSLSQKDMHNKIQTERKSPLDSLLEGLEKSELKKLKDLVDKTVADTSNMTVFRDTLETLGSLSGETFNNTQLLIKNIIPIDQIGADVSRVAKYLLDNSSSIPEKVLNARSDDFENLHLFHHLKNASETFAGMRLPGFPSVRELTDIEALKLPDMVLPNFFDNNNNEDNQTIQQAPRNLLNHSILTDNELFLKSEKRNSLNVSPDNKTSDQILNLDVPFQLPELPTLPNLENIVAASKVIPHIIPYVLADYKDKVAGWLEGTEVKVTELSDLHGTLVSWHKHIEGIRTSPYLPEEMTRMVSILEENNIGLLNLILHLMFRAALDGGTVTLNRHDLKLLDKYLLKPEQVFPILNY